MDFLQDFDRLKTFLYKDKIKTILEFIKKQDSSRLLIAIDGPGGSGKTTLAKELREYIPNPVIIHMDDFYKPKELRQQSKSETGGYFDWQRLERDILSPFADNQILKYQKYDWQKDRLTEWEFISKSSNLIIEGVYSTRKELAHYYNLKVWMDCPYETRLERGIKRDGIDMKEYWQNVWMKQENEYYEKHQPQLSADVIIKNVKE